MSKTLVFKVLTPGFSLRRATCELGDFRVWYSEETWWWALNDGKISYGSEETLDDAIAACQKYYDNLSGKTETLKVVTINAEAFTTHHDECLAVADELFALAEDPALSVHLSAILNKLANRLDKSINKLPAKVD